MISYDNYINRIQKVAKFKNFVVKFKFLIIGVLAVIIAGITALLVMKGTITSDMVLPAQITYGDSYAPAQASAFLSGVTYEYSLKGTDEWTEEKPVKAGEYLVRTVTSKAIGKGYGDPVEFEILPKQLDFVLKEGQTVTYGFTPEYTVTGLVSSYSDRVEGIDFDYAYPTSDDESEWTVGVTLNAGGIRIVDKNGNDLSDCYTYDTVSGDFAFAKRSVAVKLKNASDVYCGTAISYKAEAIADLAFDDEIKFDTVITQYGSAATLSDAGSYDLAVNENSVRILSGSADVTKYYNIISYSGATFTVNRRPVTVLSDSNEWTYDGAEHTENGYTVVDGSLAPNQRIESSSQTAVRNYNYSGEDNYLIYKIYDASGKEVTANYLLTERYGTLKIKQRSVTLTTTDGEWTYNGYARSTNGAYELTGSLANGQRFEVLRYTEVINYTSGTPNELYYKIMDGYGLDVTPNYAVTERFGTLKINKLAITVQTGSDSFEYDGNSHSFNYNSIDLSTLITNGSLALSSHSLALNGSATSVSDVADTKTENNTTKFKVVSGSGWYQTDETENYQINYRYGTLTVTPRPITVIIKNAEKVYDGTPLSSTAYDTCYYGNPYASGLLKYSDVLTPVQGSATEITDVGSRTNGVTFTANSNYEIKGYDRTNATLTVTPRPITVVIGYAEKDYDGTPLSSTAYTTHYYGRPYEQGLVKATDTLTPVQSKVNSITNAGSIPNTVEFTSGSNYEIKDYDRTNATLKVNHLSITFKLNDIGKVTYGEEIKYSYGNEKITSGYLANGEKLIVLGVSFTFGEDPLPNVGNHFVNSSNYRIEKTDGTETTSNYIATVTPGNIEITPRPVTLTSADNEWTYDGYAYFEEGFTRTGSLAAQTHLVVATHITEVMDYTAGVDNVLSYAIYDVNGATVTGNYAITPVCGKLKINKRQITVQLNSYEIVYGNSVAYQGGEEEITSSLKLADNETLTVHNAAPVCSALPDIGNYKVTCVQAANQISKADGTDSTGNYVITFLNGEMTVTVREITITSNDSTWTYDGAVHFEEGNSVTVGSLASVNHTVKVTSNTKVTDYNGENGEDNVLAYEIYEGTRRVTANYQITPVCGTLKITKRAMTVTLNSFEVTYGNAIVYPAGGEEVGWAQFKTLGQKVSIDKARVSYSPSYSLSATFPDAGTYDINYSASDVVILSGTKDVTFNYDISVLAGTLTIEQREITVTLNDIDDVTYGDAVNYVAGGENIENAIGVCTVEFNKNNLAFNPLGNYSYPDAGNYEVTCDRRNITVLSGGADVTGNYSVTVKSGSLTITPREITVQLLSYEREYGENYAYPTEAGNYANTPDLIGIDRLTVTASIEFTGSHPAVGNHKITGQSIKVTKNGADCTYNYTVSYVDGNLKVSPKSITLAPDGTVSFSYGDDEYYGKSYAELFAAKISAVELPYGEKLLFTVGFTQYGVSVEPKNIGTYDVTVADVEIRNSESGEYAADNYIIKIASSMDIAVRQINIIPTRISAVYGEEFEYPAKNTNFEYRPISSQANYNLPQYGEEIEIFVEYDLQNQAMPDVGLYNAEISYIELHYPDGSSERTNLDWKDSELVVFEVSGYQIICYTADLQKILEITKRKITVKLSDMTAAYGDPVIYSADFGNYEEITEGSLADGDRLRVITIADFSYYKYSVGEHELDALGCGIYKFNGTASTGNYEINYESGILTVTPRKITVSLERNIESVYGETVPTPKVVISGENGKDGLVYSDQFNPYFVYLNGDGNSPVYFDAGNYTVSLNEANSYFVYTNGSPSTTENYEIVGEIAPCNLEITKRRITLTLNGFEKVYGELDNSLLLWRKGSAQSSQEVLSGMNIDDLITIDGLAQNEGVFSLTLSVYKSGTVVNAKNVGEYEVGLSALNFCYSDGKIQNIDKNYDYDLPEKAILEITKKAVTVNVGDYEFTYGDEEEGWGDFSVYAIEGFVFGEYVSVSDFVLAGVNKYPLNASKTPYTINDALTKTVYNNGVEVENGADNYEVTVTGTVTVNPKNITLISEAVESVYYGNSLIYPTGDGFLNGKFTVEEGGFAYGEILCLVTNWNNDPACNPINAGVYSTSIDKDNSKIFANDGVTEVEGGIENYSFTWLKALGMIMVKPVTVTLYSYTDENAHTYDGKPFGYPSGYGNYFNIAEGLEYGEEIAVTVAYSPVGATDAGLYDIVASGATLKKGSNPSAVLNNYKVSYENGKLEIVKREMFVSVEDEEIIYGDSVSTVKTPVTYNLASGQTLSVSSYEYYDSDGNLIDGVPADAGEYSVQITGIRIVSDDGKVIDVDKNYVVHYVLGTLTISPREITLRTNDHTWEYDGKEHYDTGFTLSLQDGRVLTLTDEELELVEISNPTVVKAANGNGVSNEVTYDFSKTNYSILYTTYGTLKVNKRAVTLVAESETWTYDGEEHSKEEGKVSNAIDGHEYEIDWRPAVTEAGEYFNYADIVGITDEEGKSVIENYVIRDCVSGKLIINKRPITVITGDSLGNIYDGKEHSNVEYDTYLYGEPDEAGLLNGDTLTVYFKDSLVNVGEKLNETLFVPVSSNYVIADYDCGTLEVVPLRISIKLIGNPDLIYGEETYSSDYGNFEYFESSEKIVATDKLKIIVAYYETDPAELLDEVKNVGTYNVKMVDYMVLTGNGTKGNDNYEIYCAECQITISPKEVSVLPKNLNNGIYGEAFAGYPTGRYNYKTDDGSSVEDLLAYGEGLEIHVNFSLGGEDVEITDRTSTGTYDVNISYLTIRDANNFATDFYATVAGKDNVFDCGNYLITVSANTYTVDPRPLTVVTGGGEWEYDGEYHSNTDFVKTYYNGNLDKVGILDGDENVLAYVEGSANSIIAANCKTFAEAGTSNTAEFESVSANYTVKYHDQGALKIKQREITIVLNEINSVYYSGKPVAYESGADNFEYAYGSKELIDGEQLTIAVEFFADASCTTIATPVNAATYYFAFDLANSFVTGSKSGLENGIANYNIHCYDPASFTVNKLTVTISLNPWTAITYDGNEQYFDANGYAVVNGGFAEGESLSVAVDYFKVKGGVKTPVSSAPRNAGEYVAAFNADNSTVNGLSSTVNYIIEFTDDKDEISFTILQKNITISMDTEERVYNGTGYDYVAEGAEFKADGAVNYEFIVPEVIYLDADGAEVSSPVNAGSYTVVFKSFKVEGTNDVAENYNLTTDVSSLTCALKIQQRDVTVEVVSRTIERPEITATPLFDEDFTDEFVGNDRDIAEYYYTYFNENGEEVTDVATKGVYTVKITFTGSALILNNYDITAKDGKLTITARQVGATPVYSGGEVVYSGVAVDPADCFGYEDWHATDPSEKGFAEDYNPTPRFVFTDEKGNTTYAPVNAGTYTVTVEFPDLDEDEYYFTGSDEITFTIKQKTVSVSVSYDPSEYENLVYGYNKLPVGSITVTEEGILPEDEDLYSVKSFFYNLTQDKETVYDLAGDYEIRARLNNEYGNYVIDEDTVWDAIFTVQKATLYVKPVSKTAPYDGKTLSLGANDYVIFDGDDGADSKPAQGDTLRITSADSLASNKLSTLASIRTVSITRGGTDVSANYTVYLSYQDFMKDMGYLTVSFKATLTHTQLTFSFNQYDKLASYNFVYTGEEIDLGVQVSNELISYDGATCGLLDGDRVEVYKLSTIKNPMTTNQWVQIRIYNSANELVTNMYKLNVLNLESTKITVSKRTLNLEINVDEDTLQSAWEVAAESGYDGYRVLDKAYYALVNGEASGLLSGTDVEVLVKEEDGKLSLSVIVYALSSLGKRSDRSIYYNLNVVSNASGASVTLVNVAALNVPTTTNI
ncbi:MAG: hypothetical protein K2O89_01930 [Clostridia bacterium]|nr:hypothetical protein [Clostridia bacterium]